MAFDILHASSNITDKYVRYLKTMFDIEDPEYKKQFEQKLAEMGSFSKGPYLDVIDSFESGASVASLIKEGILNPDFEKISDIYSKTLYKHQELSIRKLQSGRNVVVSTGTGSGKTESFLVPIINSLMEEKKSRGRLKPGVRALLIYPMNALANDQISRLRSLLADYPDITFGSYTGQTEEKQERALEKYKSLNNGRTPKKNELISREKMKEAPPHILITNYSMLEYLMLRPQDNTFFQGMYSGDWHYIVLDEAHTYSGSTGIEVSMLLRRLKAYLDTSKLQFILTSATLGGENSNDEVAQFAQRLCDAPFYSEDVIRAYRIHLSHDIDHAITLSVDDYHELNDITESGYSENRVRKLLGSYLKIELNTQDISEYLYEVLLRDHTFWKVKIFLSEPKSVDALCAYMDWDRSDVTAFVNVASKAVKNRKKLFDSRYHMFIRATDGVFITLGKHKKLSLVRKQIEMIDGQEYRYFETVTCNQCHSLYLIGEIDSDSKLVQKSTIANNAIREAFLIGEKAEITDDDSSTDEENLRIDVYELCPRCGFIREANLVHKTRCGHNEEDFITLTKVKQSERTGRVTKCVRCGGVNNMGILRAFFSGQEASTSVIGTVLFEELPDQEAVGFSDESHQDFDDGFDDGFALEPRKQFSSKAKQFIAFSDNRQAAAFFATYFYETYEQFLYSRMIYENIKQIGERGKSMTNFVADMSDDFRTHKVSEMFDRHPDYEKEAWKAMMRELINSYARNSLIGLGLMKIDFDDDIQFGGNRKYHLDADEVRTICLIMARNFFEDNAISYPARFTEADIAFFSNNGAQGAYCLTNPSDKYLKSFLPKTDSSINKRYDYLQRIFTEKDIEAEREDIQNFMKAIWNRFFDGSGVLIDNRDHSGKRIDIERFRVVNTRKWYRCSKCQRITAYNVENVCPAFRCDGRLQPVNIEELEKENHYYRIYHDLDMQPLRVVEHTAQLSNEKAYKLQEQFKRQEIDVLSCSTTFEMGVDIGDLETVFMRNMPPTPSNYVQRAGRAGRSSKSAALALTFCNKSNHDFSYFENPISMINGEIQPPLFKVENEKIGIRHLYSAAIAFFWRRYPVYFRTVSDLFGHEKANDGYDMLKKYLESKPEDLKNYLLSAFPEVLIEKFGIRTYGWLGWMFDQPDSSYPNLKYVYQQYRSDINSLFEEKKRLEEAGRYNNSVIARINTYTKENSISFLSRNNILPKYGFPVDTVDLNIATEKGTADLGISLSRDLAMAISEYAPGCEVVASGNLIRSRYVRKVPGKDWRKYDYTICDNCKTMSIAMHHEDEEQLQLQECPQCKKQFDSKSILTFLIPEFGFVSESKIEKPTLIKPDRTYRTEASLVSNGTEIYQGKYMIGSLGVQTVMMEDGEISILNRSHFHICHSCGYALSDIETNAFTNVIKKEHKSPSGYPCKNDRLKKYSLGYRFKTDALKMSIDTCLNYDEAYTILQAIILSACNSLNIDHGEISGCLQYVLNSYGSSYDFIIYDTTPGGAGHIRRFADEESVSKVLKGAFDKAKNCDCGGEEGDASCYKCLRTYQNQQHHDILKRRYVIDHLIGVFDS